MVIVNIHLQQVFVCLVPTGQRLIMSQQRTCECCLDSWFLWLTVVLPLFNTAVSVRAHWSASTICLCTSCLCSIERDMALPLFVATTTSNCTHRTSAVHQQG